MKRNEKCLIVGKFAYEENILDGQTVKCKTIHSELINKYGEDNISIIDTYKWKKKPIKIFLDSIKGSIKHENIIIMPAHNGIKIFAPLFSFMKTLFKKKIYYIVIGSWLFDKVKKSNFLKNKLQNFDKIFVETKLLKKNLEQVGFKNVAILKNYKKLDIAKEILPFKEKKIINACLFSRINKEKGIMDAIEVVKELNKSSKKIKLDIYGMVEDEFKNEFEYALEENKKFIHYNGIIDSSQSVSVIKEYDILLFPTKYLTEGIPGTIIDAYAAGVPVLTSRWQNYEDIVEDGITGLTFEFNNTEDFKRKLIYIYENQQRIYKMKNNCLKSAKLYCELNALQPLFEVLED